MIIRLALIYHILCLPQLAINKIAFILAEPLAKMPKALLVFVPGFHLEIRFKVAGVWSFCQSWLNNKRFGFSENAQIYSLSL